MLGSVLIYGAGAIGRGYVALLLSSLGYEVTFVDIERTICDQLRKNGRYRVATAGPSGYVFHDVPVKAAYRLGEEDPFISEFSLVFSCVGARNCLSLWRKFAKARVVISCENDRDSATKLRALSGNPRIYFAIPDVITSSTATAELLEEDPLTVISEEGVLLVEKGDYELPEAITQLDVPGIDEQWACKLYLHNSPHAIVAYLGWQHGCSYVHEAMAKPEIEAIAVGAMEEIKAGVTFSKLVGPTLADEYAGKELRRFRNPRLFDPIARVAREPLRKLSREERLIGAAHLALYAGVRPINICKGIVAALQYANPGDPDIALPILRRALGTGEVLRIVSELAEHDPLYRMILTEG